MGGIPVYLKQWRLIIDTVTDSTLSLGTWNGQSISHGDVRLKALRPRQVEDLWRSHSGDMVPWWTSLLLCLECLVESEKVSQAGDSYSKVDSSSCWRLHRHHHHEHCLFVLHSGKVIPTYSNHFFVSQCFYGVSPLKKRKTHAISYSSKMRICINFWLVVWNMAFNFRILGILIPTDYQYFSEGVKPPTRFTSRAILLRFETVI